MRAALGDQLQVPVRLVGAVSAVRLAPRSNVAAQLTARIR